MSKTRGATAPRKETAGKDRRLSDLCSLFNGSTGEEEHPEIPDPELVARLRQAEEEIRSLSVEILERYEEATLVYRLSETIGDALGEEAIARNVLESASRMLGAEDGTVWLRDGERLKQVGMAGRPDRRREDDEPALSQALEEGRNWTREAVSGSAAAVAVPLPAPQGPPIGAVMLRGRPEGRTYRSGEVKLLTALAALTSAFVRNDRLAEESRRAESREREDEIARQIHRGLLPPTDAVFDGLDISGVCLAAKNIGGDYYGYIRMPDGSLGIAMADVSGHGVGAALYMAAMKGALQAEARRTFSPADLLSRTNEALVGDFSRSDVFATAFVARFYPGRRRMEFSNGGHHPPLLIRANGEVDPLGRGGPALGVLLDAVYEEQEKPLAEGDLLLIYTDGLIEARDRKHQFYGLERLIRVAGEHRHRDAREIHERILDDLALHCDGLPPRDDVTVVAVRCVQTGEGDSTGNEM